MLNKLEFNNLVISNKKKLWQGRNQTINKLVKKIVKLNALVERHPDNMKNKERLRKAKENMEHLKKYKCMDIVKKILLLEKPPSTVITNGRSTPEEIAVALLALNKIIQGLIAIFKQQLNLTNDNRQWREQLLEKSKRLTKILRTEEKKKKRKDVKDQKANEQKRLDWIKENNPYGNECASEANNPSADEDVSENIKVSIIGGWKVEPIVVEPTNSQRPKKEKRLRKRKANYDYEINVHEFDEIAEKEFKIIKPKSDPNTEEPTLILKAKPKIKSEISKNNVELKSESLRKPDLFKFEKDKRKINEIAPKSKPVVTHVIDPFFLTESGENYLSTAVIIRDQFSNVIDPQKGEDFVSKPTKSLLESGAQANRAARRFSKGKTPNNEIYNSQSNNLDKDSRDYRPSNKCKRNAKEYHADNIHPSWAARQKLKPFIAGFQGKKITFDDEEDDSTIKESICSTVANIKHGGAARKVKEQDSSNLHPSWLAKQKFKPVISIFQGKKIIFENEENS